MCRGSATHRLHLLRSAAYDPAFLLPAALHLLSQRLVPLQRFIRSGLLAVALASLSASCQAMRKLGYAVLALTTAQLQASGEY